MSARSWRVAEAVAKEFGDGGLDVLGKDWFDRFCTIPYAKRAEAAERLIERIRRIPAAAERPVLKEEREPEPGTDAYDQKHRLGFYRNEDDDYDREHGRGEWGAGYQG